MNYTSKPFQYLALFVSFALAVWLRSKISELVSKYITNTWLVWLVAMLVTFLLAIYVFPWLAKKGLLAASKPS